MSDQIRVLVRTDAMQVTARIAESDLEKLGRGETVTLNSDVVSTVNRRKSNLHDGFVPSLYPIKFDGDVYPMRDGLRSVHDVLQEIGCSDDTHDLFIVTQRGQLQQCDDVVLIERGRDYITARKRAQ